jgi:hypothetical protein
MGIRFQQSNGIRGQGVSRSENPALHSHHHIQGIDIIIYRSVIDINPKEKAGIA